MKRTVLASAALAVAALATSSADLNLAAPLELTIIGPRSVHKGQKLKFKAVLTNRLRRFLSLRRGLPRWILTLAGRSVIHSDRELGRKVFLGFECPVGGMASSDKPVRRLKDSDLTLLQPGDKLEFVYDDISADYVFPGHGSYQVTATYTYVPPRLEGGDGVERDRFGQKYDLTDLSPQTLEMLKHALILIATSRSSQIML